MLILALRRVESDAAGENINHQWCEYHEHETEEARKECREKDGRKDDPDVEYYNRRNSR